MASRSCEYDPDLYRKVKDAVSMQQAVEYCGLKVAKGRCLCPFHGDRHPSLKIYPNGKGYYCFSCGSGGDPITFVARYHDETNYEAARELAEAFQVPVQIPVTYRERREADKIRRERRELVDFVRQAKMYLVVYRGLLCDAIRARDEHFWEGLGNLTYVEYLLDCLEQYPEKVYADRKAVREIGKVKGRIVGWFDRTGEDGAVSG